MATKVEQQQHAIFVPFPAQGHINPMLQLAKLLHSKYNFYITFVNTISPGSHQPDGLPRFRFESIPDGLPPSANRVTWTGTLDMIETLCRSITNTCVGPFRDLVARLNWEGTGPPVTCIVADGVMSFTMKVAQEFGIPEVAFWTMSACGYMGYLHFRTLIDNGFVPLQDSNYLKNGILDTQVTNIPGMDNIKLKDFPSFIRTTNPDDFMLNFMIQEIEVTSKASAIILNTFETLEHKVLETLSHHKQNLPQIYTIGPLGLLVDQIPDEDPVKTITSSIWNEQLECISWLDTKEPNSVVYVNFGSITIMTIEQLTEFAWGLANSKKPFLWVIRPNLIKSTNYQGFSSLLSQEFINETEERSLLVSWCPQKEVLKHKSIGGFLTHNGWNSTLESISEGVPMISWPFFGEQYMNCRFCCFEWEIGMEIDNDVKRGDVEKLVRMLMEGEKRMKMKKRIKQWQSEAQEATKGNGSSTKNLDRMVNEVLLLNN